MVTVVTREPCRLLVLPRSRFRKLLQLMPNLSKQLRSMFKIFGGPAGAVEGQAKGPLTKDQAAKRIQRLVRARKGLKMMKAIKTLVKAEGAKSPMRTRSLPGEPRRSSAAAEPPPPANARPGAAGRTRSLQM